MLMHPTALKRPSVSTGKVDLSELPYALPTVPALLAHLSES